MEPTREELMPQLELEHATEADGVGVVALRGELDVANVGELEAALAELVESGHRNVVLDLGALNFIDSTGLAALLTGLRNLTRLDGHLVLACTNPSVLRLFEVTRTDTTFVICPDRERALERVREL